MEQSKGLNQGITIRKNSSDFWFFMTKQTPLWFFFENCESAGWLVMFRCSYQKILILSDRLYSSLLVTLGFSSSDFWGRSHLLIFYISIAIKILFTESLLLNDKISFFSINWNKDWVIYYTRPSSHLSTIVLATRKEVEIYNIIY